MLEGYPLAAEFITDRRNEAMHELKSFVTPRSAYGYATQAISSVNFSDVIAKVSALACPSAIRPA